MVKGSHFPREKRSLVSKLTRIKASSHEEQNEQQTRNLHQKFDETLLDRSKVSIGGLHGLLECLDEALGESVGRWMVRCASDVSNAVCLNELGKLI